MQRRDFTRLIALGAAGATLPSLTSQAATATPYKVGFVYLGPVGDFGWTYQHDIGRKAMVAALGDAVQTTFVENVPEGPDSEKVMNDLANSGHKLIFATSFGYMNYVINAAKRHPNVMFEHATGYKRAANVATYNIRFYEARYVQGVIAGKMSKTGIAGYVGSIPVPEVVQGMNAFLLGMQSINPAARLKFVLINSWYDPPKEGEAARALMDQGCDVVTQHTDSPAALQAVAGRGLKGFGQSTDMSKFAPDAELTAAIDVWGPYYTDRVKTAVAGAWKSGDVWGGFDSGMLQLSPFANMPADVKQLATDTVAGIRAGTIKVFAGPLTDQAGVTKLASGAVLDDAGLSGMQWLVKGIDGKLT